ncbi:MAG: alpha/beta hydrolase [Candidatus Aminicenantes bacterium]|nr:alpha/beta hydrolase [Candidatus Aminicenantes bacterium]
MLRLWLLKSLFRLGRRLRPSLDLGRARRTFDLIGGVSHYQKKCSYLEFATEDFKAEWLSPIKIDFSRIILFLHGGAYVNGSPLAYRGLTCRFARTLKALVLAVDYRLAPEHPYPAALADAEAAYNWLLTQTFSNSQIAFIGDSAGGGLVLSLLQDLKKKDLPLPACAVLLSPWTDLSCSLPSMRENASRDPMLDPILALDRARNYAGSLDLRDPAVSPIYGDLSGLPPLLIHVGSDEILLDDSRYLAEKAREAGATVELEIWDKMFHVWHFLAGILPQGRKAIQKIADFIDDHIPE